MTQPDFDLIGVTEIAEMAGTARSTVSNWKRRYDDFPAQRGSNPRGPLFDRREVAEWLLGRGTQATTPAPTGSTDLDKQLWNLANTMRGVWSTEEFALTAARYLVHHPVPDRLATQAGADHVAAFVAQLEEIAGGTLEEREEAIDALLAIPTGKMQFRPPDHLVRLATAILGPRSSILDPCCGVGQLLVASADHAQRLCGQETNAQLAELARGRLWNIVIGPDTTSDVVTGDALRDDAFPEHFDGVICFPPFGVRLTEPLAEADSRWAFEYPGTSGDAAWIQHVVAHVAPGGRAVMVLPPSAMWASGVMGRLRASLVRSGHLRAVVQLPQRTFQTTGIPAVLVVLERPDGPVTDPVVLVCDPLEAERGAWPPSNGDAVAASVTRWLDGGVVPDDSRYELVGLDQLAVQGFNLTPSRHLDVHAEPERSLPEIRQDAAVELQRSKHEVQATTAALDALEGSLPDRAMHAPRLALRELVRIERGIKLHRLAQTGTFGVHTPETLSRSEAPGRFLTEEADELQTGAPMHNALPGDTLISIDGQIGLVYPVTEPMFAAASFAIVRPHPTTDGRIRSGYLAAWLSTPSFQADLARLSAGTTLRRLSLKDLGSIEVPVPPVDEQDALADVEEKLRTATSAVEALLVAVDRTRALHREAIAAALPTEHEGGR